MRYLAAALIGLVLVGCTPPPPTDLVGTVHRRDHHGARYELDIRRGPSLYDWITVSRGDWDACRPGDLWPDCRTG